jgi:hypothetical protein
MKAVWLLRDEKGGQGGQGFIISEYLGSLRYLFGGYFEERVLLGLV